MAYIESFTINGLAARDRVVSRTLDRHVNIFWGLNGTGKTSLLKILHAALRNETHALERLPFDRAEVIFWSTAHNSRIRRTFVKDSESVEEGDQDEDSAFDSTEWEQVGTNLWREVSSRGSGWLTEVLSENMPPRLEAPYRHSYLPISRLSDVTRGMGRPSRTANIDDDVLDEDFAEQVRLRWQRYNSEALASIRSIQQQGLASILAHLFGGGMGQLVVKSEPVTPSEAYSLVRGFLNEQRIHLRFGEAEFVRRYEAEEDLRNVVANIQEVTNEVQEALRPQLEFQEIIQNLYSGGKKLNLGSLRTRHSGLSIEIEGQSIPLKSLSSGEKQLLRLMLEVLAAEEGTVMIDEPELSMHVDWQQVLVASMRKINPDCQLLLATHSPEVMAEVPDKYVFEL